jgi:hypothetical protein
MKNVHKGNGISFEVWRFLSSQIELGKFQSNNSLEESVADRPEAPTSDTLIWKMVAKWMALVLRSGGF